VSPEKISTRAAKTIQTCAVRIENTAERERFVRMMTRAAELSLQAKELRLEAWGRYRQLTGYARATWPASTANMRDPAPAGALQWVSPNAARDTMPPIIIAAPGVIQRCVR
jgi:hypothetical protein